MLGARVVYLEIMRPFAETALYRWVKFCILLFPDISSNHLQMGLHLYLTLKVQEAYTRLQGVLWRNLRLLLDLFS